MEKFSEKSYKDLVNNIFRRFLSVQTSSFGDAYKPGLQHMLDFSALLGDPEKTYRTIHVAGTNGKGSVANMLASVLAGAGLKVGLYTSPHILDFRERMRVVSLNDRLVSEEYVYDFLTRWSDTFDKLQLSFFEITTGLAFKWFADEKVDVAVIEVGLGGRLDSTNIITPELSIVTSIGLDHCDLLGDTLEKIAYEKAGIFKRGVPALVGETRAETAPVFRQYFAELNADNQADRAHVEASFSSYDLGSRSPASVVGSVGLTFADQVTPSLWYRHEEILSKMDLRGEYQAMNLRTVLAAIDILRAKWDRGIAEPLSKVDQVVDSLIHTAARTGFHGRWERISREPDVICDIGHNAPALKYNFAQLQNYLKEGVYSSLIIVYGVMADKNLDAILPLFPSEATWIFTTPTTSRALPARDIKSRYEAFLKADSQHQDDASAHASSRLYVVDCVRDAVSMALRTASAFGGNPLIYIGGSTFVVSEALPCFG